MSEREERLREISAQAFAAWELTLFLDTHPDNVRAMERFKKHSDEAKRLIASFEEDFGPLTSGATPMAEHWQWVDSPWPWEISEET